MIAISQDNFRAADPASDHNLSREMHLEISQEIHLNNDLKLSEQNSVRPKMNRNMPTQNTLKILLKVWVKEIGKFVEYQNSGENSISN